MIGSLLYFWGFDPHMHNYILAIWPISSVEDAAFQRISGGAGELVKKKIAAAVTVQQ